MSYFDILGANNLKRHDHLVVKEMVGHINGLVTIEFEPDNIITNCLYGFDLEYGLQYEIESIKGNTVIFKLRGKPHIDLILKEFFSVNKGDKMMFISLIPFQGEYSSGKTFKYAEL